MNEELENDGYPYTRYSQIGTVNHGDGYHSDIDIVVKFRDFDGGDFQRLFRCEVRNENGYLEKATSWTRDFGWAANHGRIFLHRMAKYAEVAFSLEPADCESDANSPMVES